MNKRIFTVALTSSFLLGAMIGRISPKPVLGEADDEGYKTYLRQQDINEDQAIKNVIVFIGDGMGPNHVSAGGVYNGKPLVFADDLNESWTYHAYSNTDSLTSEGFTLDTTKSLIKPKLNESLYDGTPSPYGGVSLGTEGTITCYTDSAAGGTAISTGKKVTNNRLALDINGKPLDTLVEIAAGLGKKTGVLTSDVLTGATPASFLSHVGTRTETAAIINSIAETSPADLIIAQKLSAFTEESAAKYASAGFDNIAYDTSEIDEEAERILCLLPAILPYGPMSPSLAELTAFSLDYLDNEEGFFLMVEGANIDKQSHGNQTQAMFNELMAFDEAVETAALWAAPRNDTLIIVTADHETGGLHYDEGSATQETILNDIEWLTKNHSRTRVRIDVFGDIECFTDKYGELFSELEGKPYWDNTDIFKLAVSYL